MINIGDMMQEMSDGAYISTTHRVIKMDDAAVGQRTASWVGRRLSLGALGLGGARRRVALRAATECRLRASYISRRSALWPSTGAPSTSFSSASSRWGWPQKILDDF